MVHPDDGDFDTGLARLLRRLARAGIEQYLVPDGLGEQAAQVLKGLPLRLGFVLEAANLLDASGWALASLPTVLLLQDGAPWADALFRRCRDWTEAHPEQSLLIVATPSQRVAGRSLVQIASGSAPYPESGLDNWAAEGAGGVHRADYARPAVTDPHLT